MLSIKALHDKKMNDFIASQDSLPKKELKLKQLINKKSKLDIFSTMNCTLDRDIRNLEEEIETVKSNKDQIDYILNVVPIFYKQARGVSEMDASELCNKPQVGIMKYIEPGSFGGVKADILEEYLNVTDKYSGPVKALTVVDDTCKQCFNKMIVDKKESTLSCPTCGDSRWFFDIDAPQWSDSVEISTQFVYERVSHFKEHLNQFQGKEVKSIPEELIESILMEMRKMRIHPESLTSKKLISILKELKKSIYYNNINSILFKIAGKQPPQLSPQLEERLIALFRIIQKPFEDHKPKNRKNFFSYSYTIHKLLEIIAIKDSSVLKYIPYFQLLKSREKVMLQDDIWKKVCKSLGWKFTYSI
jgi:hypothetical protein